MEVGQGVGREPDGAGQWGPEGPDGRGRREMQGREGWQGAEGQDGSCWVGGGRRRVVARWQGVVGAGGGMAGSLGQGGQMAGEGGDGRVQESQMAVAGGGGAGGWWGRMARWQGQWGREPDRVGVVGARRARW